MTAVMGPRGDSAWDSVIESAGETGSARSSVCPPVVSTARVTGASVGHRSVWRTVPGPPMMLSASGQPVSVVAVIRRRSPLPVTIARGSPGRYPTVSSLAHPMVVASCTGRRTGLRRLPLRSMTPSTTSSGDPDGSWSALRWMRSPVEPSSTSCASRGAPSLSSCAVASSGGPSPRPRTGSETPTMTSRRGSPLSATRRGNPMTEVISGGVVSPRSSSTLLGEGVGSGVGVGVGVDGALDSLDDTVDLLISTVD
jgi:hypothetical protein